MALVKIKPYIVDATGNYTFNGVNATGNLSSLNANLGNAATANYFIGTLYGTANIATTAGTVTTNAQPNITSVGTLTSVSVTGNVTAGNVKTDNLLYSNGTAYVFTTNAAGSNTQIQFNDANAFAGSANFTFDKTTNTLSVTNIVANGASLTSLTGANVTGAVAYATTANSVAGGNVSGQVANALVAGTIYTNAQPNITSIGSLSGLTVSNATGVVDFTTTANVTLGSVANLHIAGGSGSQYLQTDGAGNLSWVSISTSASLANGNSNVNIPSANGNVNISSAGNANIVVVTGTGANINGTLNVSGNATFGTLITSGSGGNISSVNVISGNTFIASGNITSGNITSGNANLGNAVTANYFVGTFYGTANLATYATTANSVAGGNVSGQVSNALVAGTVYTNAQPNITSVGSLSGLTVSNATGLVDFTTTANVTLGAVGNLHVSGGTNGQYLQTDGSGILSWSTVATGSTSNISNGNSNVNIPSANGNVNISSAGNANIVVVTGTGANINGTLNVSGNATFGTLITSGSGGNISNVNVMSANTFIASGNITSGNANLGNAVNANYFVGNFYGTANLATYATTANAVAGANVSGQVSNALIAGTVYTNAQPNITSVGTLSSLAVTGNITSGNANLGNAVNANYFIGNFYGTANLATYATTANSVAGGNVSGQVANALVAGTIYTNAQPNITSIGSLTGLTVSNATGVVDFTTTANVTLGAVANLHVSGGTSGQYLSTDGSGTLSWSTISVSTASISNGNSNVNIPNANGNVTISAVGNANILTVTGTGINVAGTLNTTGNVELSGANVSLGAVGNLKITGGTANYVLQTDGVGNLTWVAQSGGNAAVVTVDSFTGNGVQTVFTLSATPTGINQTSINYNGATVLRSDYTLSGANVTFSSAPASGSLIEVTSINLTAGGGGGSALTIQDEGSNLTTTASLINFVGNGIAATNTGNSVTVTVNTSGTTAARALGYSLIFGG